jgi:hypothetical protein
MYLKQGKQYISRAKKNKIYYPETIKTSVLFVAAIKYGTFFFTYVSFYNAVGSIQFVMSKDFDA